MSRLTNADMKYILKLQADNARQQAEIDRLYAGLSDLQSYMLSDKFSVDTTVQVSDIMRWIDQLRSGRAD